MSSNNKKWFISSVFRTNSWCCLYWAKVFWPEIETLVQVKYEPRHKQRLSCCACYACYVLLTFSTHRVLRHLPTLFTSAIFFFLREREDLWWESGWDGRKCDANRGRSLLIEQSFDANWHMHESRRSKDRSINPSIAVSMWKFLVYHVPRRTIDGCGTCGSASGASAWHA